MKIPLRIAAVAVIPVLLAGLGVHGAPAAPGSWAKLPAAPITTGVDQPVSVWTGREMIIHGTQFLSGGRSQVVTFAYRPAAGTWVRLADGPPQATVQSADVAVWTGSRMLVLGLTNGSYNPAANTWSKTARPLGPLSAAVTGWTGRQFLAWGGTCCDGNSRDGMAYNPAANTWRMLPAAPLQSRADAEGAWTGRELIVAGGRVVPSGPQTFRDAAAYNPATNRWRKLAQMPSTLSSIPGPALWDGREVLFLSGTSARVLAYNPATNRWRLLPAMPLPRSGFAAVWTGHLVLVWGGLSGRYPTWQPPAYGEAYDPAANRWTALPASPLQGRAGPAAVWTGRQMIVWGGSIPRQTTSTYYTDGAAYTPPAVASPPHRGATVAVAVAPDLVAPGLFYTGTDHQLWVVNISSMSQRIPEPAGGQLVGGPGAVWTPSGFAAFARGTDNALWWTHAGSRWASLGGVLTSKPAAATVTASGPTFGQITVWARGADGALWYKFEGPRGWAPWQRLGGRLLPGTAPAVVDVGGTAQFVVVVGTDHALWLNATSDGWRWSGWHSLGGRTSSDPGASYAHGALLVFVRGTDNAAWGRQVTNVWMPAPGGWRSLGGRLTSGVASLTREQTEIYALGTDGHVWEAAGTWPAISHWTRVL
jgi:Galactose oxidase, central domain